MTNKCHIFTFNGNDFVYSGLSRLLYFMEDVGILQITNRMANGNRFQKENLFDLLRKCKAKQMTMCDQPTLRFHD